MSTYDEDEALFEDIYDDAPTESKTEPKPEPEPEQEETKQETKETTETTETTESTESTEPSAAPSYYGANIGAGGITSNLPGHNDFSVNVTNQPPPQPVLHQPSSIGRESGKMFIGGLNWDTTEEKLVAYFSKFGEVTDHTIMRDNATGKSRGFGFLTFRDPRSVDEVIKSDHVLDGKLIDPKRAIAREEQDRVGKIFVGGIDPMVNERDFNDFFAQFGSIIDAQLMIDKDTGRSRGFGFITYDSPDAVDRVTVNKYLTLKGKTMEVKRAEPRGQHQQNQQNQYHNQYGQVQNQNQYQQQMTPEMMQEYWQRMQQWYMYQQQMQGEEQPGAPLNPQEQGDEMNGAPKGPRRPTGPGGMRGRGRGRGGYQRKGYHPYNKR